MSKRLLDDWEVEFLAKTYLKLKKNSTCQKLSKDFREFMQEYLDKELLIIKRMKNAQANKNYIL